jgi:hypothetical protein
MDSNETRLVETLRLWPGLDDDQLSRQSGITPRQTVNQLCHRLEAEGRLRRSTGQGGKIVNTLIEGAQMPAPAPAPAPPRSTTSPAVPTTESNNFQRIGSISNAHAGREFEEAAAAFFVNTGITLQQNFGVEVGYVRKRVHKFDLGSEAPPILVECKSYTWTSGGNSPSAKIRGMNEVMLLFALAPTHYRKILFVLKHLRREQSLAAHYIKNYGHLVPPGVEIWEFDIGTRDGQRLA